MDEWHGFDDGSDGEQDDSNAINWVYGNYNCSIFLIDAAREMFDQEIAQDEEEPEEAPFTRSMKAAHATMMRKAIGKPYDYMSIVFFNTREAKNSLDYPGIYVYMDLQRPSADKVLAMEEVIGMRQNQFETRYGHSENVSIHDALRTCQSIYANSGRMKAGKTILLFTCRDDPHGGNTQKHQQALLKARDLKGSSTHLEILHMGVNFCMNKFYKELLLQSQDDEIDESQLTKDMSTLTDPTTRLEELMRRVFLIENIQNILANLKFKLAPNVAMAVGVHTLVRKTRKPRKKNLWKNTNEEVRANRKYFLLETARVVTREDYDYYQKYGGRRISLTMDESRNIGNIYEPGMELLGFKPISWLKTMYYFKEAKFIYPKEDVIKGSTRIFTALMDRCLKRKKLALVRLKVRDRANVALAALVPQQEVLDGTKAQLFPPGFEVHYLPFADNFSTTGTQSRSRAEERQVDLAKKFVKKLRFNYVPENFDNPDIETMWEIIQALALNRSQLEPVIDCTLPNLEQMEKQAGPLLREYGRLMFSPPPQSQAVKTKLATSALLANKRVKIDNDNLDVETMVRRGQAQQLSVPVLKSWLTARGVNIAGKKKAELMQAVIDAVCA